MTESQQKRSKIDKLRLRNLGNTAKMLNMNVMRKKNKMVRNEILGWSKTREAELSAVAGQECVDGSLRGMQANFVTKSKENLDLSVLYKRRRKGHGDLKEVLGKPPERKTGSPVPLSVALNERKTQNSIYLNSRFIDKSGLHSRADGDGEDQFTLIAKVDDVNLTSEDQNLRELEKSTFGLYHSKGPKNGPSAPHKLSLITKYSSRYDRSITPVRNLQKRKTNQKLSFNLQESTTTPSIATEGPIHHPDATIQVSFFEKFLEAKKQLQAPQTLESKRRQKLAYMRLKAEIRDLKAEAEDVDFALNCLKNKKNIDFEAVKIKSEIDILNVKYSALKRRHIQMKELLQRMYLKNSQKRPKTSIKDPKLIKKILCNSKENKRLYKKNRRLKKNIGKLAKIVAGKEEEMVLRCREHIANEMAIMERRFRANKSSVKRFLKELLGEGGGDERARLQVNIHSLDEPGSKQGG